MGTDLREYGTPIGGICIISARRANAFTCNEKAGFGLKYFSMERYR